MNGDSAKIAEIVKFLNEGVKESTDTGKNEKSFNDKS